MEEFDTNLPAELQSVEEKMKELMEIEQADKLQEEFDNFKKSCDNIMQKKKNLIIESEVIKWKEHLNFSKMQEPIILQP